MRTPKIVLDPGHGGNDPGAVGVNGLRESDVVLRIAREVQALASEFGECSLTREDDSPLSLAKRVELGAAGDVMVSIHANAFKSPKAEGYEVLYGKGYGESKALANYVLQALSASLTAHKNRGLIESPSKLYQRSLFILATQRVPTVIVEAEFLTNPERGPWLASDEGVKQVAYAITSGVKSYLKSKGFDPDGDIADDGERYTDVKPVNLNKPITKPVPAKTVADLSDIKDPPEDFEPDDEDNDAPIRTDEVAETEPDNGNLYSGERTESAKLANAPTNPNAVPLEEVSDDEKDTDADPREGSYDD
jgi:hypothetical protein